ncbi:MAG: hypothetical protein KA120_09575 [Candidatus Goldbacteria bacterium]|nr:hypothetical protein [Candidatus Goldiibacteriota bacterium]
MINYKRITIVYLIILAGILFSYIFLTGRLVNGMLAGYFTGVINFFILTFLVKKIFDVTNKTVTSRVVKMIVIYLLKIVFFAFIIFLIVVNRKIFSIIGFLIGFTLTVVIIFIESLMLKKTGIKNGENK